MFNLAIGDKLLIKQTAIIPVSPWRYRLIELESNVTVVGATGITAEYVLVTLDSATFDTYEGKTLLLEILTNAGALIEDDLLLLSGPYGKLDEAKLLAGLLGENMKHYSPQTTDFQDGHEKHKTIYLYTSSAMSAELESYDWTQAFVTDFTPDARYQTQQIKQVQN